MSTWRQLGALSLVAALALSTATADDAAMSIHSQTVERSDGSKEELSKYKGKVLLIVNVASQCGFTRQYKGMQELYDAYKDKGLVVMAFPCNQFGRQEPGSNEEIQKFCESKFGVTFPVFAKIDVNGDGAHGLYKQLKDSEGGGEVKWNFEKFLVSKDGKVLARYRSRTEPMSDEVRKAIEAELKKE